MVGIVSQGSEARLLQDGINAVATIEYKDYETQYSKIFETKKSEKAYEYPEAVRMVLESFDDFHPDIAAHAKRVFDDQHLDSEIE